MTKPDKKNEYMTVRDPGEEIRAMLDELRRREGERNRTVSPTRTDILRLVLQRELERLG